MADCFYSAKLAEFLIENEEQIFGKLAHAASVVEGAQGGAWFDQIRILKESLPGLPEQALILFELSVPRLGKRIDAVLVFERALVVLEFKIGAEEYSASAKDQVWDYALDLKNFHLTSHGAAIVPVLVATNSPDVSAKLVAAPDLVYQPVATNTTELAATLRGVESQVHGPQIHIDTWAAGVYRPTPTIIEAASALYAGHGVANISRSGAEERNLSATSDALSRVIEAARTSGQKAICFVTGVPGAGKTLVGLNVATRTPESDETYAVYLSGNGPLVEVLTEALARDEVKRKSGAVRKGEAKRLVSKFIQNVHHYRDAYLKNSDAPFERVAIFDEAQRAWDFEQTAHFMRQRRGIANFRFSEPEYLISCMERHAGWAVVICLVGGGQEINKGEVGIAEWLKATFAVPGKWLVHISPELQGPPYSIAIDEAKNQSVRYDRDLHLSVSMRSFRANKVSHLVNALLSLERQEAHHIIEHSLAEFPVVLTRSIDRGRAWLRDKARGTERPGLLVSSSALRLKPCAIDVRAPIDPVHWFLASKEDVRSSHYLEDAATEFQVQGLEIDWAAVVWDGDLRYSANRSWQHMSFKGSRWEKVNKPARQRYLENAYRVLLTRARQGMVIIVPRGSEGDPTRAPACYDGTFEYLRSLGIPLLDEEADSPTGC